MAMNIMIQGTMSNAGKSLLADVVRGGLDMSFVYRVLRREV